MQSKSEIKYEPIINTPKNRLFNKKVCRIPLNSVNMSEILHNRIMQEIDQLEKDKKLIIEVKLKRVPPVGVVNKGFIYQ